MKPTHMCLDVVDGLYSFKHSSPVNVIMSLKPLCAAGELRECSNTFAGETRGYVDRRVDGVACQVKMLLFEKKIKFSDSVLHRNKAKSSTIELDKPDHSSSLNLPVTLTFW